MDPIHHEKIADKLMQYRGKIPQLNTINSRTGICAVYELRKKIDELIWQIEKFAESEELELIR
jgi:hypothetical protein